MNFFNLTLIVNGPYKSLSLSVAVVTKIGRCVVSLSRSVLWRCCMLGQSVFLVSCACCENIVFFGSLLLFMWVMWSVHPWFVCEQLYTLFWDFFTRNVVSPRARARACVCVCVRACMCVCLRAWDRVSERERERKDGERGRELERYGTVRERERERGGRDR